jgi:hypothetical protein
MNRLAGGLAAVAALIAAGAASAGEKPARTAVSTGAMQVYVCDRSDETRRAFKREHGHVAYVSARDLVASPLADDGRPRCITGVELQRYKRLSAATQTVARLDPPR